MSFIHLIGFGGQARAIAPSLIEAGFDVAVYLRTGSPSFEKCAVQNIPTRNLSELSSSVNDDDLIIFACPDRIIGEVYQQSLSQISKPLHHILLHGYAVWSKDILVNAEGRALANLKHSFNLCAPKAIGPELRAAIVSVRAQAGALASPTHSLKAAFFSGDETAKKKILNLATEGLGFALDHLIPATFEQETVGDLISEQLLLCGGLFSLLEWTIQEMKKANVPEALIQEECITELQLVVNVLKKQGLASTVEVVSDSAKAGAVMMREKFIAHKLPELLHAQATEVLDGTFLKNLKNETEWKQKLKEAFNEHSLGS